MSKILKALVLSLILLSAALAGCGDTGNTEVTPSQQAGSLVSLAPVVDEVMPSVVYIFVEVSSIFPGQLVAASGSGVILSSDGYILTNRHVVEGAQRIEVTTQDACVFESSGVWMDDLSDLAVVKVEASDLPTARFADPSSISVGDWVIALGHPLGLSPEEGGATVTVGVASNLDRSFVIGGIPYYDIIQTDAAINPGNSGGPLVNLEGEVIGINSAVATQAQNIGYAINVSTARRVYENLVEHGKVLRPYLGIIADDVTPSGVCALSLAKTRGALIVNVEPGGPADEAGLGKDDVIVRLGEADITSATQLMKELWKHSVGESLEVVFWRGDMELESTVALRESPSLN